MLEHLMAQAERPPKEVKGVSQGFLDGKWAGAIWFIEEDGNESFIKKLTLDLIWLYSALDVVYLLYADSCKSM